MRSQTISVQLFHTVRAPDLVEHARHSVRIFSAVVPLMLFNTSPREASSAELALGIVGGRRFHFPMSTDSVGSFRGALPPRRYAAEGAAAAAAACSCPLDRQRARPTQKKRKGQRANSSTLPHRSSGRRRCNTSKTRYRSSLSRFAFFSTWTRRRCLDQKAFSCAWRAPRSSRTNVNSNAKTGSRGSTCCAKKASGGFHVPVPQHGFFLLGRLVVFVS